MVEPDYRQEILQIFYGVKSIRLGEGDTTRYNLAYALPLDIANQMVTEALQEEITTTSAYNCKSFTDSCKSYSVGFKSFLRGCSCPDYNALCKHIFLVSRVKNLPFTFKKDTVMSIGSGYEVEIMNDVENFDESAMDSIQEKMASYEDEMRCKDIQNMIVKYQKQLNNMIDSSSKQFKNDSQSLEHVLSNIKNWLSEAEALKNPFGRHGSQK